ncbi:TetR/AcrR family transcriptional regulator [Mariniluteicoccus flavus]
MPKLVDPTERRQAIIEAVFRLVCRDGITGASLRHIADEAGLNIGSVRHYFDSADDLLEAAARAMADRVANRIRSHEPAIDAAMQRGDHQAALQGLVGMLEELMPLDEARRAEATVWLAFTERSRTRENLKPYAAELLFGSRELARALTGALGQPDEAAEALAACVDGLILAAVHFPENYPAERQRAVLAHQIDTVTRAAAVDRPTTD